MASAPATFLTFRYLLVIAALVPFGLPVEAFTTCITSEVVTPKVEGKVVATFKGRQTTIPGAEVSLFGPVEKGVLVAKTSADSSGQFRIVGIKSGRYRLRATSPGLLPAEALLQVSTRRLGYFDVREQYWSH
jgi:hypothetical protein